MVRPLTRVLLLGALLLPATVLGWGFNGHRRLFSKIHEPLPQGCLRSWLQLQAASTSYQDDACDPDRWRETTSASYDPYEAPRHYLDIDWAQPIESYPRSWADAQARFGQYAEKNGRVPWWVEDRYAGLVAKFKTNDSAGTAQYIAWLSHYVADAFAPFHSTRYSDPKYVPADGGIDTVGGHSRYESHMLQTSAYIDGIATRASANYLGTVGRADPRNHIFDIIIAGNGLAPTVRDAYVNGQGDLPTLYAATMDLTARRWGDALTLLASIVASAWVDAGKPLLAGMPTGCNTAVPQGRIVLKGYALPGDGGIDDAGQPGGVDGGQTADAGTAADGGADAGAGATDGGDGGWWQGGGGAGYYDPPRGGGGAQEEPSCGCTASSALLVPFGALLLLLARRRRA